VARWIDDQHVSRDLPAAVYRDVAFAGKFAAATWMTSSPALPSIVVWSWRRLLDIDGVLPVRR